MGELERFLKENFSDPAFPYAFWLTPGELCDVAEYYLGPLELTICYQEIKPRIAESAIQVSLQTRKGLPEDAHPDSYLGFTVVGLYVFLGPAMAKYSWGDHGIYPEELDVERVLDIRGRYALNFAMTGTSSSWRTPVETLTTRTLWERLCQYCQVRGVPV